jgi:TfoX/Sxy family transcriptional regulator of competence genes
MTTTKQTITFLLEQLSNVGDVSARPMFGEYGLYCGGKVVALVCNDQLFLKPTHAGRAFIREVTESPAYQGAKPSLLITADLWDDSEWLCQLIQITAAELPLPKPKKPKKL